MHKRGKYNKDSNFVMTGKIFKKENMYNPCFHSISIESI